MKKFWKNQRGSIAIEAALIMPVFCLLIVGGLAFGIAELECIAVATGTESAARVAQGHPADAGAFKTNVCRSVPMGNCARNISVSFEANGPATMATVGMPIDLSMIPFLNLGTKTFTATAQFIPGT